MYRPSASLLILLYIALLPAMIAGKEEDASKLRRVIDQTYEHSIYAALRISGAIVYINKAESKQIFAGEFLFDEKPPAIAYEVIGEEGRLSVRFNDSDSKRKDDDGIKIDLNLDDIYGQECTLNFSEELPLSLVMDLGVVKGDWDLGGLKLEDCEINVEIGKAVIDFKETNPVEMRELRIENGLGKIKLYNLCNANFDRLRFEGGLGDYYFDFGGTLNRDAEVDIELGMGKIDIRLPRKAGVRIEFEDSFLTKYDVDDMFRDGDYYYNKRWRSDEPSLDIRIDAGVGKVNIEWID